ncbi:hypothetical protein [Salinigranum marinum]|uniref:hypothetical protein n=1 Tax=Salinigranum marinum TaxID=1515595 RepID=UPI002989A260|nr:hypothetical protein [Salinigranum marinum]
MSADDRNRCAYALAVDAWNDRHGSDVAVEPRFLNDGSWHCHRRTRPDDDYCLFHDHRAETSVESRRPAGEVAHDLLNGETDDRPWNEGEPDGLWEVPAAFPRDEYKHRQKQFIGASLGPVRLSNERIDAMDAYPVDLRCVRVETLDLRNARVGHELRLSGVAQTDESGAVALDRARIEASLDLDGAVVAGDASLDNATVTGDVSLDRVTVAGDVTAARLTTHGTVEMTDANVTGGVLIEDATVGETLTLDGTEVAELAALDRTDTGAHVTLDGMSVGRGVSLRDARVGEGVSFDRLAVRRGVSFAGTEVGTRVVSGSGEIGDNVILDGVTLGTFLVFEDISVGGDVRCQGLEAGQGVTCTDGVVEGDVDLRMATVDGHVDGNRTEIGGTLDCHHAAVELLSIGGADVGGDAALGDVDADGLQAEAVTVRGRVDLDTANIRGLVELNGADVADSVSLISTTVDGQIELADASVDDDVELISTDVDGGVKLDDAAVGGDVSTSVTSVTNYIRLEDAEIAGEVSVSNSDVEGVFMRGTDVDGDVALANATVDDRVFFVGGSAGGSVIVDGSTVGGRIAVTRDPETGATARVGGRLAVEETTAASVVVGCELAHPAVEAVSLRGSTVDSGSLQAAAGRSAEVVYDFDRTTIGDVDIAADAPNPFAHARFLETSFAGFVFSSKREQFRDTDWMVHQPRSGGYRAIGAVTQTVSFDGEAAGDDTGPQVVFDAASDLAASLVDCLVAESVDHGSAEDRSLVELVERYEHRVAGTDRLLAYLDRAYEPVDVPDRRAQGDPITWLFDRVRAVTPPSVSRSAPIRGSLDEVERCAAAVREALDDDEIRRALATDGVDSRAATELVHRTEAAIARDLADPDAVRGTDNQLESTYAKAKNGASDAGDETAAGNFFQKEAAYARRQHWNRALGRIESDSGPVEAGLDWLGNVFLWATMGYGERPLRVLGFAASIVVAFAMFFWAAQAVGGVAPFAGSGVLGYLSGSLGLFVTLVITQPEIQNDWIRLAAQLEGFLGVFVVGMFVVAVTRAIHR